MSSAEPPLLVEPVVAWPRQAETDCDYLVTVDLRGPLPSPDGTAQSWPYPEEELTFTVALEGSPFFVCAALDEPRVVLHRFGGTYGPARFSVSTGHENGAASLWLTISNQWGVPVRKAELRTWIGEREPGRAPVARPTDQEVTTGRGRPEAPESRDTLRTPDDRMRPVVPGTPVHRELPAGPRPRNGRQGVTISFAGFNRPWAAWIGDRLQRRGVDVVFLRWDAPAGVAPADLLSDLTLVQGRILVLISEAYFQLGGRTHEEWNAALREVVARDPDRFAAVSVTTGSVPAATAVLAPVDLVNTGPDEAERRLLERLGLPFEPLREDADGRRRGPRFPSAMPEVWGNVPRRNNRFTGREQLLRYAHDAMADSEPGAGVLALYGMSGVGKTQLAAEYVYRFGSEYDVVWWVDAGSRLTFRRLLAELAPKLGLSTGAEYGERLRAVRDALRRGEPYSRWLLILDGADEPDQIWDLVPTGPGHVLITSRNPEWGEHNSKLLEVRVYDRDESVAFIRRRAPRLSEAEADQLAYALEDLPLLLDQTAGWLNDSEISVEDYLGLLGSGVDHEVLSVSTDFPSAFRTAWSILLDKLRETVPESVELLRLCTFFAPGFVPLRLLREMPHDDLPDRFTALLEDPLLWNKAINQLRQYSVVRLESHGAGADGAPSAGESVYVHRMVHQIVHRDIPARERQVYADAVGGALAAADPGRPTDTRLWDVYAEIVPHLHYADVLRSGKHGFQTLVLNCLRYMWFTGEYADGIELAQRARDLWSDLLGASHPRVWELAYHYANLLRSSGDFARTEAIDRAAVEHFRAERGEQDLDHLRAASGLAGDLRGLGRYTEALRLDERLYETYREVLGEQDSRTLNAANNLGFSLRLLGRYADSLAIDHRTMEARRRLLQGRHPWTLFSEVSYAINLRLLGRYAEAESVQSKNVRECHLVLGADNPQTLRAEHNLALCRLRTGDRATAGTLLAKVLERYERKLGDRHAETLAAAVSQSCFAREHGDVDQARAAGESIVARYGELLTDGHPFVAGVHANHALVLRSVGERDQAHVLVEQAWADLTAALGEDHPDTLGCALNVSALRTLVGDADGAVSLSADTTARAERVLGRTHPLTLSARVAWAADLRATRDRPRADKAEREALEGLEATLGRHHPLTASARARTRPSWDFEPQAS
ncbi:FxSxx-COOH system tetratricopeptide repeat protein [Streptomyces longwoodensis]|uniref:FxSxx-COOH system tetratricopeptide repeat protein n=1 Tax=Streptomyces longwoodensis TaxID=68231 RepID=UPI0033E77F95